MGVNNIFEKGATLPEGEDNKDVPTKGKEEATPLSRVKKAMIEGQEISAFYAGLGREPPSTSPPPAPVPPPPHVDEKTTLDIAGIVKSHNDLILGMQSKIIDLITS